MHVFSGGCHLNFDGAVVVIGKCECWSMISGMHDPALCGTAALLWTGGA